MPWPLEPPPRPGLHMGQVFGVAVLECPPGLNRFTRGCNAVTSKYGTPGSEGSGVVMIKADHREWVPLAQ